LAPQADAPIQQERSKRLVDFLQIEYAKNARLVHIAIAVSLILLLALLLRLGMRKGLDNPDSFAYILAATKLGNIGPTRYLAQMANLYENRIAIVFPLAVTYKLFGLSELSSAFLPLLISLSSVVTAFALGYLVSFRAAVIAGLIAATVPQDVGLATALLPDTFVPFYSGASLLFFMLGLRQRNTLFYIMSGTFLFLAFQSRATSGILIVPLLLTAFWTERGRTAPLLLPTGTFVALVALFWLFLFWLTGDPLHQYKLLVTDATVASYIGTGEFLGYYRGIIARFNLNFGLFIHIAIISVFLVVFQLRKDRNYLLPAITFLCLYLYFEFGSTTLTRYEPIWKMDRFLSILTIPGAVLIAATADELIEKRAYWTNLGVFSMLSTQIFIGCCASLCMEAW
jgi:hypothetical protein